MPKLFVANTTMQNVELSFRRPTQINKDTGRQMWGERIHTVHIPSGQQVPLLGGENFTDAEEKAIFEHQAQNYGAIRDGDRSRGFVGLIFSNDPIKMDRILDGLNQNKQASDARADKMLGDTAASLLRRQTQIAQDNGKPIPERVELEVSADRSKDIDVGGKGAEAVQPGVEPKKGK